MNEDGVWEKGKFPKGRPRGQAQTVGNDGEMVQVSEEGATPAQPQFELTNTCVGQL